MKGMGVRDEKHEMASLYKLLRMFLIKSILSKILSSHVKYTNTASSSLLVPLYGILHESAGLM